MSKKTGISVKCLMIILGLLLVSSAVMGCGGAKETAGTTDSQKVTDMTVSFQPSLDSWAAYSAIKEGLDKEKGLKLDMMFFDSGMPQIEAIPAHQWAVASTGNVPTLMASLRYDTYAIGVATDESNANCVLARPDSPVFKTKGFDTKHPNAYGTPDDLKGKTFLVTTVSSGHYVLSQYLKAMGLTEKDVVIKNVEQAQAMAAFEAGEGDFVVLWSPFLYRGFEKGWKTVANGSDVDAKCLMVLLADKQYADAHPDEVVKFLDVYYTKIDQQKKDGEKLAADVQTFFKDWGAMDITVDDAKMDLKLHPVYDVSEQLKLLENGDLKTWLGSAADFFVSQGKFTADEAKTLEAKSYGVNDTFMKELAKQKGITQ